MDDIESVQYRGLVTRQHLPASWLLSQFVQGRSSIF